MVLRVFAYFVLTISLSALLYCVIGIIHDAYKRVKQVRERGK